MDFVDLFWNISQSSSIQEIRDEVDKLQRERTAQAWDVPTLVAENHELKLRVSLLVRLLIAKGAFTAEEYAALISQAE